MDEIIPTMTDMAPNDSPEHRREEKSAYPKSLHGPQNQLVPVNKSTEGPVEHEEISEKEHSEQEYQNIQHEKMQEQQQSQSDLSSELKFLDWDALQRKFDSKMQGHDEEEERIIEQFDKLVASMKIWAESSLAVEEDRAKKRLRTRIAYVQHSESRLEEKKKHYLSVVSAFQSALALLKDP